jgi:chaperonin GroEL
VFLYYAGIEIIRKALRVPAQTIIKNTGVEPSVILEKILAETGSIGYDALEGEITDLMKRGIIDPTKVG